MSAQAVKQKTLEKIKKLRAAKNSKRQDEEDGLSEQEDGEDFIEMVLKEKEKAKKPKKVVVLQEDGDEEEPEMKKEEKNPQSGKSGIRNHQSNQEEIIDELPKVEQDVQIEPIAEENPKKAMSKVERPYKTFTISVGFPDSVIQKCQVDLIPN
jgi:hypothetical protein